jgi:hypothetical protein
VTFIETHSFYQRCQLLTDDQYAKLLLLAIYSKGEQPDLGQKAKKRLRKIVESWQ